MHLKQQFNKKVILLQPSWLQAEYKATVYSQQQVSTKAGKLWTQPGSAEGNKIFLGPVCFICAQNLCGECENN